MKNDADIFQISYEDSKLNLNFIEDEEILN